ncbi:MAG: retropepsin-like aspartic protease [Verrucomicrobiota bacterium]
MSWAFEAGKRLIIVRAEVSGPEGSAILSMALDTGATHTFIRSERIVRLGYDLSSSPNKTEVTTGSGVEYVPVITVSQFSALGQQHLDFSVTAMDLPENATIDGVIGLDFLRNSVLTLDFRKGQISFQTQPTD